MIKHMHFLLSCSKKHIGIYIVTILSTLSIFLMYLVSVILQNNAYNNGEFLPNSGLYNGYYQEMVVYVMNGLAMLYLAIFIYKSPKEEGYELNVLSRKSTRMNIMFSRIILSFSFVFFIATLQMGLLVIPQQADVVITNAESTKWLLSIFFGNLIVGSILTSIFMFVAQIFNYMSSIIMGSIVLLGFPLMSIVIFEATAPYKSKWDKYETRALGSYVNSNLTLDKVMPTVEGDSLVFNNLPLTQVKREVIDLSSTLDVAFDWNENIEDSNKYMTYNSFRKADGWNGMRNIFNIFSNKNLSNKYRYKYYASEKFQEFSGIKSGGYGYGKPTHLFTHTTNNKNVIQKFLNIDSKLKTKATSDIQKIIRDAKSLLDSNDALAKKYREFSGGMTAPKFWSYLLNDFDYHNETIADVLNYNAVNIQTKILHGLSTNFENPDNWSKGILFHQMMLDSNYARYHSTAVNTNPLVGYGVPHIVQQVGDQIIQPDYNVWTKEDKEYETDTPWTYILPAIATFLLGLSMLLYMKKDIK